jgi:hypothetical protein
MPKVDVGVQIEYDVEHPERTVLKTNMNRDGVEEILEGWIRGEMMEPKDVRPLVQRPVYTIRIGVDLSDDTFFSSSDTGNRSLTLGIVADVFARLSQFTLQPLV